MNLPSFSHDTIDLGFFEEYMEGKWIWDTPCIIDWPYQDRIKSDITKEIVLWNIYVLIYSYVESDIDARGCVLDTLVVNCEVKSMHQ